MSCKSKNLSFADVLQKECSWKFRKFYRKHLCWSLFLIKLQASRNLHFLPPDTHMYVCVSGGKKCNFFEACDCLKKRLQHRYFPVKFAKFLRTPFWRHLPTTASVIWYESYLLSYVSTIVIGQNLRSCYLLFTPLAKVVMECLLLIIEIVLIIKAMAFEHWLRICE